MAKEPSAFREFVGGFVAMRDRGCAMAEGLCDRRSHLDGGEAQCRPGTAANPARTAPSSVAG